MTKFALKTAILCSALLVPHFGVAQTETAADAEVTAEDANALLSAEELQTLVGPVALYPDTLLIQVLVAATFPLDVVKADRVLKDNPDASPEELKPKIEAAGWDESVEVLATAFPDVLNEMAVHIDWTETAGDAMLAQSDDVMAAVQVMRAAADAAGTLASGDEQTVEVTQEDNGDQTIIIQPADPEIVYVPQYDPEVVYVESDNNTGDIIGASLIAFGTFAIMDEIFDNDDPWNDYWGCRNCGGWNGRPIVNNPDIDIDIDGDVNIGNRPNAGWEPDDKRKRDAQDKISNRKGADGATQLPVKRQDRGDEMRANLSKKTGAADISRDKVARDATQRERPTAKKPGGDHKAAVNRTAAPSRPKAQGGAKSKVQKPKAAQKPTRKPAARSGGAMNKRASAPKAKAGGSRGRAAAGGGGRRR